MLRATVKDYRIAVSGIAGSTDSQDVTANTLTKQARQLQATVCGELDPEGSPRRRLLPGAEGGRVIILRRFGREAGRAAGSLIKRPPAAEEMIGRATVKPYFGHGRFLQSIISEAIMKNTCWNYGIRFL